MDVGDDGDDFLTEEDEEIQVETNGITEGKRIRDALLQFAQSTEIITRTAILFTARVLTSTQTHKTKPIVLAPKGYGLLTAC